MWITFSSYHAQVHLTTLSKLECFKRARTGATQAAVGPKELPHGSGAPGWGQHKSRSVPGSHLWTRLLTGAAGSRSQRL